MKTKILIVFILLLVLSNFILGEIFSAQIETPRFYVWMGEGKNHGDEYLETQFEKLKQAGVDGELQRRASLADHLCEQEGLEHPHAAILRSLSQRRAGSGLAGRGDTCAGEGQDAGSGGGAEAVGRKGEHWHFRQTPGYSSKPRWWVVDGSNPGRD